MGRGSRGGRAHPARRRRAPPAAPAPAARPRARSLHPSRPAARAQVFTCNYGAVWMDAICGTTWADPKAAKAKAEAQARGQASEAKGGAKGGAAPGKRVHMRVAAY